MHQMNGHATTKIGILLQAMTGITASQIRAAMRKYPDLRVGDAVEKMGIVSRGNIEEVRKVQRRVRRGWSRPSDVAAIVDWIIHKDLV